MELDSIFERLLLLPLFQGLSREELIRIVENVKFHFTNEPIFSTFQRQSENAEHLRFLLQGKIQIKRKEADVEFIEILEAPCVLFPECLFGRQTKASHTCQTITEVNLLEITKHDFIYRLMDFTIFRISTLNYLCSLCYKNRKFDCHKFNALQTLFNFLDQQFMTKSGHKEVVVKLQTLANIIGISRLNTSHLLHRLEEANVLEMKRNKFVIPSFEKLEEFCKEPT
ncbi:MAG: Crp/Fnr family transcriptional regulator [Bacteroidaceae bacterium]|nr:Crp/Fnr family transcriptional regulator [Bacteroidaceae bacterium]